MQANFSTYLSDLSTNPLLVIVSLLVFAVIVFNGWIDAPGAIATTIFARSIKPKIAVIMASFLNFLGVIVMALLNTSVARTFYHMVDFEDGSKISLAILCAGLCAIVIWTFLAWLMAIPTSISHALVAWIAGAGIASSQGFGAVDKNEIVKVLYGFGISIIMGFVLGFLIVKVIELIFKGANRKKSMTFFQKSQIGASAFMAFLHGAQDGQKSMGIFLLSLYLVRDIPVDDKPAIPFWIILICALLMALGTSLGGYKIMKKIGNSIVTLNKYQGFYADLAASISILFSSVAGMPLSTTQTKTVATMGVGAAKRFKSVKWNVAKDLVMTWVISFPACGLIGYVMAKLFLILV